MEFKKVQRKANRVVRKLKKSYTGDPNRFEIRQYKVDRIVPKKGEHIYFFSYALYDKLLNQYFDMGTQNIDNPTNIEYFMSAYMVGISYFLNRTPPVYDAPWFKRGYKFEPDKFELIGIL